MPNGADSGRLAGRGAWLACGTVRMTESACSAASGMESAAEESRRTISTRGGHGGRRVGGDEAHGPRRGLARFFKFVQ